MDARETEFDSQALYVDDKKIDIFALVHYDLETRQQVGKESYNADSLYAFNGRDALREAYEEALDLAMYLRQAIAERDSKPL